MVEKFGKGKHTTEQIKLPDIPTQDQNISVKNLELANHPCARVHSKYSTLEISRVEYYKENNRLHVSCIILCHIGIMTLI